MAMEIIDLSDGDISSFESKFQTSFLGTQLFFWLKDSGELNERTRKWLLKFAASYQGPHTIAFFVPADAPITLAKEHLTVMMPEVIDQKIFGQLLVFLDKSKATASIISRMCKGRDAIALDSACLLIYYAQVLGTNMEQFVTQWFDKIVAPERSLFTLSGYFFAKKAKLFFELWEHIGPQYAQVFWVSYWSENVWRAHHYVALSQAKQFEQAKKISNRLPFSFLQRDWKLHSTARLKTTHQQLYELDYALKNGTSDGILDAFYAHYFNNQ